MKMEIDIEDVLNFVANQATDAAERRQFIKENYEDKLRKLNELLKQVAEEKSALHRRIADLAEKFPEVKQELLRMLDSE